MEDTRLQAAWHSIVSFIQKHPKTVLIAGIVSMIVFVVGMLFFQNTSSQTENSTAGNAQTPDALQRAHFNPLINATAIEKLDASYKKIYEKKGATYTSPFANEGKAPFDMQFAEKGSFVPFLSSVYAASYCNAVSSAPNQVPAYSLYADYNQNEAQKIAKLYKISTQPSSLAIEEGVTYKYYFADPNASAFFSLMQPSGTYTYHRAFKEADWLPATETLVSAREKAKKAVGEYHMLPSVSEPDSFIEDVAIVPGKKTFIFNFAHSLSKEYKLVDSNTIRELGTSKSICDVSSSRTMNYAQVWITQSGKFDKVINQTRKVKNKFMVTRLPIGEAWAAYKNALPVDPIVIGNATFPKDNPPVLTPEGEELVWFDLGDLYPQLAYIPMYLVSSSYNGSRVFVLFPAVSQEELEKSGILEDSNNQYSMKLGAVYPPPLAVITPPPGGLCFGNLIDYEVRCSANGTQICGGVMESPSDKDKFNVCEKGAQVKSDVFSAPGNSDPCQEYLKRNDITITNYRHGTLFTPSSPPPPFPGGEVSCTLEAKPC